MNQDDEFRNLQAPGLARADHPLTRWGSVPSWVREEVGKFNWAQQAEGKSTRVELTETEDDFGNPFTLAKWYTGGSQAGVEKPFHFGMYYNPTYDQLGVSQRFSSTLKFFAHSGDVLVRGEGQYEKQPYISRERNFAAFLNDPYDTYHWNAQSHHNRGEPFWAFNSNELTPAILRSMQNVTVLPQQLTYFDSQNKPRSAGVGHDEKERLLEGIRQDLNLTDIFARDNYAMSAANYFPTTFYGQRAIDNKSQRRLYRGMQQVMDTPTQPRTLAQASGFFQGQEPDTGTPMHNLFIDDPLLFSEGGSFTIGGHSWVGAPVQYPIPGSKDIPRSTLEEQGYRVGNIYGDQYPGRLPSGFTFAAGQKAVGDYELGNHALTVVMGMVYHEGVGWTASMLPMDPFESAERKSIPGAKFFMQGVEESHPLFQAAFKQFGVMPETISAAPQKPGRLFDIALHSFMAHDQGAAGVYQDFVFAANALGISQSQAESMMQFHHGHAVRDGEHVFGPNAQVEILQNDPNANLVAGYAAMNYLRQRSTSIRTDVEVSTFALRQMQERMGQPAFEAKYGTPDLSGSSAMLKNYEMFTFSAHILEAPLGSTSSGRTQMSPHYLNLMARNQPAAYEELINRDLAGEFRNPARQILRANLQNQGMDTRNHAIDVQSEMDLGSLRAKALQSTGGEEGAPYYAALFGQIAQNHPNQYLRFGDTVMPPAAALSPLLNSVQWDANGKSYTSSLGADVAKALDALAKGEQIPGGLRDSLAAYASQAGPQKQAKAITAGALTGGVQGTQLLPQWAAVANERDMRGLIEGMRLPKDARADMLNRFKSDGLVGFLRMQESNEFTATHPVMVFTREQSAERFPGVEHLQVGRGNFLASQWAVSELDKDLDKDLGALLLTGLHRDQVDWSRGTDAFYGRGKETAGLLDKIQNAGSVGDLLNLAHNDFASFFRQLKVSPLSNVVGEASKASYSTEQMARTFSPFVEALGTFGRQMAMETGADPTAMQRALAVVGNQPYQEAMDMSATKSKATMWMRRFLSEFTIGNPKVGQSMSVFKGITKGHPLEPVLGTGILGGDMATLSLRMFDRSMHMELDPVGDEKKWQPGDKPSKDKESYFGNETTAGYASFLAVALARMGEIEDPERIREIRQALESNFTALKGTDPGLMKNPKGIVTVLQAITGKQYNADAVQELMALANNKHNLSYKAGQNAPMDDILSLMLGTGEGDDSGRLKNMSVMGAYMAGTGAYNTQKLYHEPAKLVNAKIGTTLLEKLSKTARQTWTNVTFRKGSGDDTQSIPNILSSDLGAETSPAELHAATMLTRDESSFKSFSKGGYTGEGAASQPAGVVHAGEYVLTKREVQLIKDGKAHVVMAKVERDLSSHVPASQPSLMNNVPLLAPDELAGYQIGGLVSDNARAMASALGIDINDVMAQAPGRTDIRHVKKWADAHGISTSGWTNNQVNGLIPNKNASGYTPVAASPTVGVVGRPSGSLAAGRGAARPTALSTGLMVPVGSGITSLPGLGIPDPSDMTMGIDSAGLASVSVTVPFDPVARDAHLRKYVSRMTAGRGTGAQDVLADMDFAGSVSAARGGLNNYLDMEPEARQALPPEAHRDYMRLLGTLQSVDKNVGAMSAAGQAGLIPPDIQSIMTGVGATLQTAESQGFKGVTQAQTEDEARNAFASRAAEQTTQLDARQKAEREMELGLHKESQRKVAEQQKISEWRSDAQYFHEVDVHKQAAKEDLATQRQIGKLNVSSGDADFVVASGLSRFTAKLGEVSEMITKVNTGHDAYIKNAERTLQIYDTLRTSVDKADEAFGLAKGDRTKLGSDTNRVLDRANAGLRDELDRAAPGISRLRQDTMAQQINSDFDAFGGSEGRQDMLRAALFSRGRTGARDRAALPDEVYESGLDTPFGTIRGRGALNAVGAGSRLAEGARGALSAYTHLRWNVLEPMMQSVDSYQQYEGSVGQAMASTGQLDYGQLMSGQYGQLMRRQTQTQIMQQTTGRQIYNTYSGLLGVNGQQQGQNVGFLASVGAPAFGAAMMAEQLFPQAPEAGLFAGLAVGGIAGAAYFHGALNDKQQLADNARSAYGAIRSGNGLGYVFSNPVAAIGMVASHLPGGNGAEADRQQRLDTSTMNYIQGGYVVGEGRRRVRVTDQIFTDVAGQQGYSAEEIASSKQRMYTQSLTDQGVSQDQALGSYSWSQLYAGGNISDPLLQQMTRTMTLGRGDVTQVASQVAGALGIGAANSGGQYATAQSLMAQVAQLPANRQALGLLGLNEASQNLAGAQAMRNRAGLPNWATNQPAPFSGVLALTPDVNQMTLSQLFPTDPARQSIMGDQAGYSAQSLITNPVYAQQTAGINNQVYGLLNSGKQADLIRAQQITANAPIASSYSMQMQTMSDFSPVQQAQMTNQYLNLNPAQASQVGQVASGNRYAATRLLGQTNNAYNLVDLQTGFDPYTFNINAQEYGGMQQAAQAFGMSGLLAPQSQIAGGSAQINAQLLNNQMRSQALGINNQRMNYALSYQMTTGGQYGAVDGQGFATQGDNLSYFKQLAQGVGFNFNTGNGMGQWQVEDAQTRMQRAQQDWGMQMQGQQIGISRAQYNLSGQQFNENYGLQQQQFQYNTAYQRNNMNIQQEHTVTQEGWQMQDLQYGRSVMDVQFGWQQEDFARNTRYARGREKRDLMREQQRSTVMYAMQAGHEDTQENRQTTQMQWEKDQFEREKSYFEQTTQFQKTQMDLEKQHFDQNRVLENQRMTLVEQDFQKQRLWLLEGRTLEDQNRLLTRQFWEMQSQMNQRFTVEMQTLQLSSTTLNNQLTIMNLAFQTSNNQYGLYTQNLHAYADALLSVNNAANALTGRSTPQANGPQQGGGNNNPPLPPVTGTGGPVNTAGRGAMGTSSAQAASSGSELVPLVKQMVQYLQKIADQDPATFQAIVNGVTAPAISIPRQAQARLH